MAKIEIGLVFEDGRKQLVRVGRPADLIAFAERFDKVAPDGPHLIYEGAWLTHRALRISEPLEEWIDRLDEISANPEEVARLREELEPGKAELELETANGDQPTTSAIESPV